MVTDPISDYLTRVRNAIAAQHAEVEMPASRLKKEMTRILAEQGYINEYALEPTPVGEAIRIKLKYTDGRRTVISGLKRVSRPGRRRYVTHEEIPRVHGRDGHGDPVDLGWRDDGPRGEAARRRRRGRRLRVVTGSDEPNRTESQSRFPTASRSRSSPASSRSRGRRAS